MISASSQLKDIFYNSRTVDVSAGCTIEYNMNMLLDNITVSTSIVDGDYIDDIQATPGEEIRINPFKKLFPIDSILKPFRPINSGIKYYINVYEADPENPVHPEHTGNNAFYDYRTIPYPAASPRVYYPGVTTYYKYWITPEDTGINAVVNYVQSSFLITEAYATGSKVVYKTSTSHGLNVGKRVVVSGPGNSSLNLSGATLLISSVPDARTFSVTNSLANVSWKAADQTEYKTGTVVNSSGTATPTKPALANKIVVKFEKYHSLPATCTIAIDYSDATPDVTISNIAVPSSGTLILYYNGTSWSTTPPFSSAQAISYPAPLKIKSITVNTPSAGTDRRIGLVEISARWVKDISSDLISFDISKESSSNANDILPVGNITANSLSLSLAKYDQSALKVLTYNRDDDWEATPNNYIYFAKNAEIKPHFKVYHLNGAVTEGLLKYDRVEQGSYYLDTHSISQFGDVEVSALDGSKQLMETIIPNLIYENAPITAIITGILDSIGFSNYNINIKLDNTGKSIDTSIPSLALWWSEDNKTVWDSLQEICRDIQMNAFFDENNVFQFYSRDFLYGKTNVDWEFYYAQSGNKLPNIVDFKKQEIASANQVKIIWKTPMSSLYTQSAINLWASEPSFLISGGLRPKPGAGPNDPAILATEPAELIIFDLDIDNLDPFVKFESTFNYSGYFLVDSEVFEYDAIQFAYEPLDSEDEEKVFVGSEADWAQYRSLSKTGPQYFKPTGRYRIKARGVFNTEPADHYATSTSQITSWYQIEDEWD